MRNDGLWGKTRAIAPMGAAMARAHSLRASQPARPSDSLKRTTTVLLPHHGGYMS